MTSRLLILACWHLNDVIDNKSADWTPNYNNQPDCFLISDGHRKSMKKLTSQQVVTEDHVTSRSYPAVVMHGGQESIPPVFLIPGVSEQRSSLDRDPLDRYPLDRDPPPHPEHGLGSQTGSDII